MVCCETRGTSVSVVMKFGGTSVADAAAIERLAAIVRRQIAAPDAAVRRAPLVVVSALARVTDGLLAAARAAEDEDVDAAARQLDELLERHLSLVQTLTSGERRDRLVTAV